jgi:CheY-like chemotaxis protein
VESEVDNGSSFFIEFNAEKRKTDVPVHSASGDWSDLSILVVEDAPEILELFTSVLAPQGVHIETAISGERAAATFDITSTNPYNIIFIDLNLSDMTGLELAKGMIEQGAKAAFVLMTNDETGSFENDARALGLSEFLPKPIFPSALTDCIKALVELPPEENSADEPVSDSADGIFAGITIMVAEDVEINREILGVLLEDTEITIDFAVDGEEAVERFSAPNNYRLILMDIHMPNVDGFEATRRIRASGLPRADTIPIVAMTANVFREDIEKCLAVGMNDHLGKPVDMEKVINTLRRFLL